MLPTMAGAAHILMNSRRFMLISHCCGQAEFRAVHRAFADVSIALRAPRRRAQQRREVVLNRLVGESSRVGVADSPNALDGPANGLSTEWRTNSSAYVPRCAAATTG